MTQRALLVGSSFSAAPIFFELKKRGLEVAVCGRLPEDPCHQYADASFFIDYARRDDLLALVDAESFDFLVPTCNDFAYLSAAWVAEQRGFAGFDPYALAVTMHTKAAFRAALDRLSLPSPRCIPSAGDFELAARALRWPLLVKPVDSFSGRGVSQVSAADDLPAAVHGARAASRSGDAVIEEFVSGRLFSHSAFVGNQSIVADFFVDEYCTVYPYQVNCSNHPSSLEDDLKARVRDAMGQLVRGLQLADGLLHTQFIADGHNFWIIECMRRCPGDLYGHLVELSSGAPYTDFFVRPFLGEVVSCCVDPEMAAPVGRHTISSDTPLATYSFAANLPEARTRIIPLKGSGAPMAAAPFDKLAILFAEFANAEAMLRITPRFSERIAIYPHHPWQPRQAGGGANESC